MTLIVEHSEHVLFGVARVVYATLLLLIVYKHEDADVAENRQLNGFLQQSLLSLAVSNFPMVEVLDNLYFFESTFSHDVSLLEFSF